MKLLIFDKLISILVFLLICTLSVFVAPYLTADYYNESTELLQINPMLPIAIKVNEADYKIIQWREYSKSPKKYADQLITEPSGLRHILPYNEGFKLNKTANNIYQLAYDADSYIFWSEYRIIDSEVKPQHFRMNGAFIVMPVLLIGLIISKILNFFIRRNIIYRKP